MVTRQQLYHCVFISQNECGTKIAEIQVVPIVLIFEMASIWYRLRSPHRNSALPLDVQSTVAPQRISGRTSREVNHESIDSSH